MLCVLYSEDEFGAELAGPERFRQYLSHFNAVKALTCLTA